MTSIKYKKKMIINNKLMKKWNLNNRSNKDISMQL